MSGGLLGADIDLPAGSRFRGGGGGFSSRCYWPPPSPSPLTSASPRRSTSPCAPRSRAMWATPGPSSLPPRRLTRVYVYPPSLTSEPAVESSRRTRHTVIRHPKLVRYPRPSMLPLCRTRLVTLLVNFSVFQFFNFIFIF